MNPSRMQPTDMRVMLYGQAAGGPVPMQITACGTLEPDCLACGERHGTLVATYNAEMDRIEQPAQDITLRDAQTALRCADLFLISIVTGYDCEGQPGDPPLWYGIHWGDPMRPRKEHGKTLRDAVMKVLATVRKS